jgi:hypothetical protein
MAWGIPCHLTHKLISRSVRMQKFVVVTNGTRITTLSDADSCYLNSLSIDLDSIHFADSSLRILHMCILNKCKTLAPTCQWIAMNIYVVYMAKWLKQFL